MYTYVVAGTIRSFADEPTADVYYGRETKAARRLPKSIWPVIRRKLDALNRAKTLQDLRLPAGNRLEPLKGAQAGRFSIRVNDQYRITFLWTDNGKAQEVVCEDYH